MGPPGRQGAAAAAGPPGYRRLPPPTCLPSAPRCCCGPSHAPLQEQALRKAADLQQQASHSAKQGLHGARLVSMAVHSRLASQSFKNCDHVWLWMRLKLLLIIRVRRWPRMWRAAMPKLPAARWAACCTAPPPHPRPCLRPACWCAQGCDGVAADARIYTGSSTPETGGSHCGHSVSAASLCCC